MRAEKIKAHTETILEVVMIMNMMISTTMTKIVILMIKMKM
jgi:hypothetical protein